MPDASELTEAYGARPAPKYNATEIWLIIVIPSQSLQKEVVFIGN